VAALPYNAGPIREDPRLTGLSFGKEDCPHCSVSWRASSPVRNLIAV